MKHCYSLKCVIIYLVFLFCFKTGFSQNVGINSSGSSPDASAGLDVSFTDKGLLIPRVALTGTADASTISSPTTSLLVYNTATAGTAPNNVTPGYYYYSGSAWLRLNTQFTTSGSNIYYNTGNVGIGTASPLNLLTVNATNPLALHGLQTSPTTSDSVLTLSGGVVKRLAAGALTVSSSNAWALAGNSGTSSTATTGHFVGTSDAQPLRFRTSNLQRMQITSGGNVGIGMNSATTPSYKLQVGSTADPLFLSGVQVGATTDSTLTIASGVVKKLAPSWSSLGNTGTTAGTHFIGTTDAKDFVVKTNNTEQVRIASAGQVGIGSSTFTSGNDAEKMLLDAGTDYNTGLNTVGNIDDFFQVIVQNQNDGNNASSDFVVASDQGTQYVDFGINSSGYVENKSNILNQPYTAYLYASCPQWFYIGHGVSGKGLVFFTNTGSTNANNSADGVPRMEITSAGNVGIGNFVGSGADVNNYLVSEKLMVDGNVTPKTNNSGTLGTSTYKWNAVYATNGTIQTSDRRLKTNIQPLRYGLKQVLSLEPVSFKWKSAPTGDTKLGLIAQDLKRVLPEVVSGDETKENLGVNYADLVPVLINAMKEQQSLIDRQQKQITEQQKQFDELKKLVEGLAKK